MIRYLFALLVLVLVACHDDHEVVLNPSSGREDITVNVVASQVLSRGRNALGEQVISSLTVAVYANNGKCIQQKAFFDVEGPVQVDPVEKSLFPLHVFAIANVNNQKSSVWPWSTDPSDWANTTHSALDKLSLVQRTLNKAIDACNAPLPMYGQNTLGIEARGVTITLTRPVVRVSVSNRSSSALTRLAFTGLAVELLADVNGGSISIPADKAHDYTYTDSNIFTPAVTTRYYYFMPTTTAALSITDAGGVVRSKQLPALVSNHTLSIAVYDKTIECDVSIEVNPDWNEEVIP